MKQVIRLAVAALLLVGLSAVADVREQLREAVELASGIDSSARSMMEVIPRTCRVLRRAAREARGTAEAEPINKALAHCRRAMEALNNGNPRHAKNRMERAIAAITDATSEE